MKATVQRDNTAREITIEITDGPQVDVTEKWHDKPKFIQAQHATIRVVDGEIRRLSVSGGLIKKDGSTSDSVTGKWYWSVSDYRPSNEIANAPAWAQQLFNDAPQGVTTWELVTA